MKNKKVAELKKLLPKGYKISAGKTGLCIFVSHEVDDLNEWTKMNVTVRKAAAKLHLDEVGSGTGFGMRDWSLVDLDAEKELVKDAKQLHDSMKAFFKKWSIAYCDSSKAYDYIEKMRAMIESDEA